MFISKKLPRPAHSHLNFIKDEEDPLFITDIPKGFKVTLGWAIHSSLSLNGLYHDRTRSRINGIFHCPNVIEGNILKPGHERFKTLVKLLLTRCGQGSQSPSVEGSLHGNDFISILSGLLF